MDVVDAFDRGTSLVVEYEQAGDSRLLDEGIALLRESLHFHEQPLAVSTLATALVLRYECQREPRDLDEAMSLFTRLPAGVPLEHVATVLRIHEYRYELDGDAVHLDRIIAFAQACLAHIGPGQHNFALLQHLLGMTLRKRFGHTHQREDLVDAIAAHRIAAGTGDTSARPVMLLNLASCLRQWQEIANDLSALDEAQQAISESLSMMPLDHPAHDDATYLAAVLGRLRYEVGEEPDAVDIDFDTLRRAVASAPDPDTLGGRQSSLGTALLRLFEHTGDQAALRESLHLLRQSVLNGKTNMAGKLNALGAGLLRRYQYFGDLGALREAVEILREAVTAAAEPWVRANVLATQSTVLQALGRHERNADLADQAVTSARAAVNDDPGRAFNTLEKLTNALRLRFNLTGAVEDLDEASTLLEELLRQQPFGTPGRVRALSQLGHLWKEEHDRTGESGALDAAIGYIGQAMRADPQSEAMRAGFQYEFALLLQQQAEETGDAGRLRTAARSLARAAANEALDPLTSALAASAWSNACARGEDWPQALQAAELAMARIPEVTTRRLARADREHRLANLVGVAADAAACACHAGQPELALRWLEQGRGVLLGQMFESTPDLNALEEHHPHLARAFTEAITTLDELDFADAPSDLRHEAAVQRDEVLTRIRSLPGHESFLRPPTLAELQQCAADGPVVLVNVSVLRCDALIVLADRLITLALPELTFNDAVEHARRFSAALNRSGQHGPGELEAGDQINAVLAWLWDTTCAPVLEHLPGGTRVWWSPGGPLSALPLHAAGRDEQCVLDRVVSSYTPTVRALGWARERLVASAPDPNMLVVAVPKVPGHAVLAAVRREVEALNELWNTDRDKLYAEDATPENVLAALPEHPYVHFACHGVSDHENPALSNLLLHQGEPLTVLDVSRLRLRNARLAVLSACHTARTTSDLADEAVHLAGAFQFAGYASVVGTLWHVNDRFAASVAIKFHSALRDLGIDQSAKALHDVLNGLRGTYRPSLWATYRHTGV